MPKKGKSRKDRKTQAQLRMKRAGVIPFFDPVREMSADIHARAFSARSPKMFGLIDLDQLPKLWEDWDGAAHEAGIALRMHADIPYLAKESEGMWRRAVDDWTKG